MTRPEGSVSTRDDSGFPLSKFLAGPKRHFTPLYIIGGLILLVEFILVGGITQTSGVIQGILTGFVGLFLVFALVGMFAILWSRPQHLYSPSEYGTPTSATELADALERHRPVSSKATMRRTVGIETLPTVEESDADEPSLSVAALSSSGPLDGTAWETLFREEISSDQMDFDKSEDAFNHVQDEQDDVDKRIGNELLYFFARFKNGDIPALQRLEALAQNTPSTSERAADAHLFLGLAYQLAGSHQKAEVTYQMAIEKATSDRQRALIIVNMATAQVRLGRAEEAEDAIEAAIASTSDGGARVVLYEGLARQYDETDQQELKALALEKALEYEPENTNLRFDAARSYGASDLESLSLLHYQIILQISPKNAGALNNAGVAYRALSMHTLAVDSYRKAYALGNTLSAANLAYLYLEHGFAEDASGLLDDAQRHDSPHPNVAAAIAAVSQTRERDEASQISVLKRGREQRVFLSAYAEQYFTPRTATAIFEGNWQSDEGYKVLITQQNEDVQASWNTKNRNYRFTGKVRRGTAKLSGIRGTVPDASSWTLPDEIAKNGYAYLSTDRRSITIMGVKEEDVIFMRLDKID